MCMKCGDELIRPAVVAACFFRSDLQILTPQKKKKKKSFGFFDRDRCFDRIYQHYKFISIYVLTLNNYFKRNKNEKSAC